MRLGRNARRAVALRGTTARRVLRSNTDHHQSLRLNRQAAWEPLPAKCESLARQIRLIQDGKALSAEN
jgi:hypothetical protein